MKKFNAKKIRIAGAALAIGAAAIISTQAFADDSPSTDSTIVVPSVLGATPTNVDVLEDAKDDAANALEDAQDAAADALADDDEASDDGDEASDDDDGDVDEASDSVEEDD